MIQVEINPVGLKAEILKNLNTCFPGWGNEDNYNWFFERAVTSFHPDIILFRNQQGEIIAGSAMSYRKIALPGTKVHDIGIMTGSWTLPASRGLGCFTKMIEVSQEMCANKNIPLLTAFVTDDNPSYRRLESAGSIGLVANNYFFENQGGCDHNLNVKKIEKADFDKYRNVIENHYHNKPGFHYNFEQFCAQYIDRLFETHIFQHNGITYIVENGNVLKVLFVSDIVPHSLIEVFKWLHCKFQKKIMWFCTYKPLISEYCHLFEAKNGFFTVLGTGASYELDLGIYADPDNDDSFHIQLGDKV